MKPLPPPDAYVNGTWVATQRRYAVVDPYDDKTLVEVADCDDATVDVAIAAMTKVAAAWRATPGPERGKYLRAMGDAMLANEARYAEVCTRENGKALKESVGEVKYAASFLLWFAGEAERIYGETIPASRAETRIVVTREPVGPCALITPWNFPYAMLTRKIGAALAAGCPVVCKPAHQTPLSALLLAEAAHDAKLPAGVLNVVPSRDAARIGTKFIASPAIRKISFTGSTKVGMGLMRAAADDLKRVSLELGGNAPFVVLADADLDNAVAQAMIAKFRNTGQSCVAANRFIVDASIADAFTTKLVAEVAKFKTGHGLTDGVDIGPLIDDNAVVKVRRLVDDAIEKGAKLVHGARPDGNGFKDGKAVEPGARIVAPLVLSGITADMAVWREEIFGPVVAIRTATSEADALAQANDTDAGLVAYVMSKAAGQRFAEGLQSGMVGVNEGLVSAAQAPFGGIKHSGLGREGSRHGIEDYTNLKYVATKL
ncbi:MAG TPA: NAD-dependent succinate-semialdehyde dehydrogenase [Kofleriaceae bacterium]|jgi:succinate-semialdehyde dehydrogenase/glutarate-semialdehyde dehydrogenase